MCQWGGASGITVYRAGYQFREEQSEGTHVPGLSHSQLPLSLSPLTPYLEVTAATVINEESG